MVQSIATVIAHSREQLAGNGAQGRISHVAHISSSRANAIAQVIGESSSQRTFGRKDEPSQILRTLYLTPPD